MTDTTLSQAIKEAYAAAPSSEIAYHTLELWHPDFSSPIRVVRDVSDLTATLESSAPRDPSSPVLFVGFGFDIIPPDVNYTGVPQCTIEMDNVSREIVANIELALASSEQISVIYRMFISSDLSAPQNNPPLTLTIISITADVFKVRAVATFGDLVNKRFPAQDYTVDRFPGLGL